MENKFKVGDKVKIREDLAEGRAYGGLTLWGGNMSKRRGHVVTVSEITQNGFYMVGENPYGWSEEMLVKYPEDKVIFNGKTTVLIKDGKKYASKCKDGDAYDREKGLLLCLAQANGISYRDLQKMIEGGKVEKAQVQEVGREAKVGEYIKIVNPQCSFNDYHKGDIFKVEMVERGGVHIECDDEEKCTYIYHKEYVVLENYEPPKKEEKPEFKPHLLCGWENYGVIGEPTNYKDVANRPLCVGDTVELFDNSGGYYGEKPVVNHGKAFIMGIECDCNNKTGYIRHGWKIIKKRDFEEIKDVEAVGVIRYNKTEKGAIE